MKYFSIIGFGKSGLGTVEFLLKKYPEAKIRISDLKAKEKFSDLLNEITKFEQLGLEFEFSKQSIEFITFQDQNIKTKVTIILSPGIPPKTPLIQELSKLQAQAKVVMGTDFDLFTENLTEDQEYIAITGTNGKTTTTSLIAHILSTEAVGNIGKPFLEFDTSKFLVCEISSFQLFHSKFPLVIDTKVKLPKAAIYLNLTADHLDWHADLNEYQEAKAKLFQLSSTEENFLIFNYDDEVCRKLAESKIKEIKKTNSRTKVIFFSTVTQEYNLNKTQSISAFLKDGMLYIAKYLAADSQNEENYHGIVKATQDGNYVLEIPIVNINELNLVGEHNYSNMLAAISVAIAINLDFDLLVEKLKSFIAVPHRLEYIATIAKHKVFNDSKATNPDSSEKALNSFDKSIIIVGGKDKHLDLNLFFDLLTKKAYAVVAIGELKDSFYKGLKQRQFDNVVLATNLEDALEKSLEFGKNNDLPILLSPASSSFDMFTNYEERGNLFKKIVQNYNKVNAIN